MSQAQPPGGPVAMPPEKGVPMPQYKAALRRAIRRNAAEPEINFLNITAMLDIMTIILVFLLKNLGETSASVPQSDDLRIPASVMKKQPSDEGVVVTVSKSQILVGDSQVLKLPGRESMVQSGVGASNKRSGPNDLYIVPLGNALQAARKLDRAVRQAKGQDPTFSEAIVIADKTTPYRLLIEVFNTLGEHEFAKFHLMVIQSKTIGG